jgi:hypothetical protein
MKKFLLVASLLLLLVLIALASFQKPIAFGKIEAIKMTGNAILLSLENSDTQFIAFSGFVDLKEGDSVKIFGKRDDSNPSKIIISKIIRIKA